MKTIEEVFRGGRRIIEDGIRNESRAQGHYLTGAMERSLAGVVGKFGPMTILVGTAVDYTRYVNNGVQPGRIPYGGGSGGGGGTSAYIEGLRQFFLLKGLSPKEALSAAFATAKTHIKEGMPSKGSSKYSSTGQRTGMIEEAISKRESVLDSYMINGFDEVVEFNFQQTKSETV